MSAQPSLQLRLAHATIPARDIDLMAAFYTDVLGFHVTDRGEPVPGMGEMVFLSQTPDEHHQIVLVSTAEPAPRGFAMADHLAFRTGSLDDLRTVADRLVAAGNTSGIPISHGNAWSVYFTDPEGNGLELFVDTPFHVPQPYADRLDLSATDGDIEATTRHKVEPVEGSGSFEEWRREMAERLGRTEG